jgi:hypothetical protein
MLGLDLSRIPLVRGVTTVQEFKNQAATVSALAAGTWALLMVPVLTASAGGRVVGRALI